MYIFKAEVVLGSVTYIYINALYSVLCENTSLSLHTDSFLEQSTKCNGKRNFHLRPELHEINLYACAGHVVLTCTCNSTV